MLLAACGESGLGRLPPPGPQQPLVVGLSTEPLPGATEGCADSRTGFYREIARLFAAELGVALETVVVAENATLDDLLRSEKIHMAAVLQTGPAAPGILHSPPLLANCAPPGARRNGASAAPPCGWAFPASRGELRESAADFIAAINRDGSLRQIEDRYFGHLGRFDDHAIEVFLGHVRERLPHYRRAFQEAQEITGIDWRLLAALGYQESKWDPLATSPTGVRGLMMLTGETADRLGVKNRLDPNESIRAGAKYLAMLMDDLPDEIRQPDRLWFALAAYNLGMGHLNGGRQFAPSLGRDPNIWVDMKEVLPLLSRPEYYTRLKSGRARGGEAVAMVASIRNYHDLLMRLEPAWNPPGLGVAEKPRPEKKRRLQHGTSASTPPR